jgi:7-cyano-7-deazaguanine tRNA-ribosyltransferase
MDFYVSWYPGDPDYARHDDDCSMLISITSVSRDWTVDLLPFLPKRLMIDSGGYRFASTPSGAGSPHEILERQLTILAGQQIPTTVCARDFPILDDSISSNEKDKSITQTIAYAYELLNLLERTRAPSWITPMAVVQGSDADAIAYCAHELSVMGYPLYGIGSLAQLRNHEPIMVRVSAAVSVLEARRLHIFGISGIRTVRTFRRMGIRSVDSSRPAKAAAYNEIFYSRPFRRYGIFEPKKELQQGRFPDHRRLREPLPCDCPVCLTHPGKIMEVGRRDSIRSRALHNYYHLKRTFAE